jgi:hypothetical protein
MAEVSSADMPIDAARWFIWDRMKALLIGEARTFVDFISEKRGRVDNLPRPTHEDVARLHMFGYPVGILYELAIALIVKDPADLPSAWHLIVVVDAGLLRERHRLNLVGFKLADDRFGRGCIEIFDGTQSPRTID